MTKSYCIVCDKDYEGQRCPTCADRRGLAKRPKPRPTVTIICIMCDAENTLGDPHCKQCEHPLPRNCGT